MVSWHKWRSWYTSMEWKVTGGGAGLYDESSDSSSRKRYFNPGRPIFGRLVCNVGGPALGMERINYQSPAILAFSIELPATEWEAGEC